MAYDENGNYYWAPGEEGQTSPVNSYGYNQEQYGSGAPPVVETPVIVSQPEQPVQIDPQIAEMNIPLSQNTLDADALQRQTHIESLYSVSLPPGISGPPAFYSSKEEATEALASSKTKMTLEEFTDKYLEANNIKKPDIIVSRGGTFVPGPNYKKESQEEYSDAINKATQLYKDTYGTGTYVQSLASGVSGIVVTPGLATVTKPGGGISQLSPAEVGIAGGQLALLGIGLRGPISKTFKGINADQRGSVGVLEPKNVSRVAPKEPTTIPKPGPEGPDTFNPPKKAPVGPEGPDTFSPPVKTTPVVEPEPIVNPEITNPKTPNPFEPYVNPDAIPGTKPVPAISPEELPIVPKEPKIIPIRQPTIIPVLPVTEPPVVEPEPVVKPDIKPEVNPIDIPEPNKIPETNPIEITEPEPITEPKKETKVNPIVTTETDVNYQPVTRTDNSTKPVIKTDNSLNPVPDVVTLNDNELKRPSKFIINPPIPLPPTRINPPGRINPPPERVNPPDNDIKPPFKIPLPNLKLKSNESSGSKTVFGRKVQLERQTQKIPKLNLHMNNKIVVWGDTLTERKSKVVAKGASLYAGSGVPNKLYRGHSIITRNRIGNI